MAILVLDPLKEARVRGLWPGIDDDRWTEVWEGVTVLSPLANNEHQRLASDLTAIIWTVIQQPALGQVFQGVNLTDRTPNWVENYRNPDVVVSLNGNPARDLDTHYLSSPDFAAEIISPGEPPTAKFGFYESIGTREVMVLHRDQWRLEFFDLQSGKLVLAGASELPASAVVASAALGLTFQLVPGPARPQIAVAHPASGQQWKI